MAEPGPSAAALDLVRRSLRDLRWSGPSRVVKILSEGASGSQVFLLDLDGGHPVLKVTEDPTWHERAGHELSVYDQLGGPLGHALPALLAAHCDTSAVRLLLQAHRPFPAAPTLNHASWVAVAEQLGRVHGAPFSASAWLRPRPRPSPEEVAAAVRLWDQRGSSGSAVPAARGAERLAVEENQQPFVRPVLTHGDCHVGNLLQGSDDRILWVDWQEVCLSDGLDDLVFLWQRAEFDGAHPPRQAMTTAYAAARRLPLDNGFRSAITASELRLLLVAWPHFLSYGPQDRRRAMTQRLHQITTSDGP